ncbi:MAG TPA: thioredoxin family protein [Planctomycetota bacterium]|nr:thioredoxin family protein [Planctomycetota bacterium]
MEILVFGKESCAKCRTTKHKLGHLLEQGGLTEKIPLRYYDLSTVDGMTEGAWRDVLNVPTVIVDDNAKELTRWSGVVPHEDELKKVLVA